MKQLIGGLLVGTAFALSMGSASAATCDPGKPGSELSSEEAQGVYECLAQKLHDGYMKGKKRWISEDYVSGFRDWTIASTAPAAPGFHSGRFLVTWVNEVGASEYLKYAENPTIPAGTVIAKETFSVSEKGKARRGPLFFMEKAAAGTSPQTNDWFYMMVSANGKPQAVNVVSACHECHEGFAAQGDLGYPAEDVRIVN